MSLPRHTVFIGLSGGVDSSVAAARLCDAGYDVVGVFIKVWQPSFLNCNWEAERIDAMRVAAHLGIPFLTCDAEDRYKHEVAEYLVTEYAAGRTPNPDVMCNKHVKFGVFLEFARAHGATYIATGHYAQKLEKGNTAYLYRGIDTQKDQSYFLWSLSTEQLAHALFPLGADTKEDIRKEAAARGLPTAQKPDSQGICFLGEVDMKQFLSHYIPLQQGVVHDTTGAIVGHHDGAAFYTIGQRHGFTIYQRTTNEAPYYVVAKDTDRNTLTVSHEKPQLTRDGQVFTIHHTNWITEPPQGAVEMQIRYRQSPVAADITIHGETATITPTEICDMPAEGQSCVLYRGAECLGGGLVHSVVR